MLEPELRARLLAHPALQKQAEVDARAYHDAFRETSGARVDSWDDLADWQRKARIDASARLLASLDWKGRAWAIREIVTKLGWNIRDVVPTFIYMPALNESSPAVALFEHNGLHQSGRMAVTMSMAKGASVEEALVVVFLRIMGEE